MNPFKYSDEKISERELMIALPSIIIGVGILSLPREIALVTLYNDGWISILLAGLIFTFLAILGVKLAAFYPEKSFLEYTAYLVTRPVAIVLVCMSSFLAIVLTAYTTRSIAYISQQFLFEHTPMEVLALAFLLVVVYAVSGSRAGIFRLNVLFIPIILFVFLVVGIFNITWLDTANYFPMFKSSMSDYISGIGKSLEAYIGFGIVLYYVCIVKQPKNLTKNVIIGMGIPILFYIMIFIMTIGVFGNAVTANLEFPTIELAKRVDIPGGILERIDSIVFSIWIMSIFTSVVMLFDIAVLLISSIFTKINKRMLTFMLAPIIFYIGMLPQQIDQVKFVSSFINQLTVYFTAILIVILFIIAKIRGVKNNEKN